MNEASDQKMVVKMVWKFALQVDGMNPLEMPVGAKVLTVQMQGDKLMLWALVTPGPMEKRRFMVAGTGWPIAIREDSSLIYIGTVQDENGGPLSLVWHVFELA